MRKFRLIKEYPGSPELGEELEFWDGRWRSNITYYVLKGHPIDYPEFWEEVIEKEYEILSFIANRNIKAIKKGIIIRKNIVTTDNRFSGKDDSLMYSIIEADEEKLLKNSSWDIHSVKRVSDGEVFTVGDNIIPPKEAHEFYMYKRYPIRSFYIDRDDSRIKVIIENGCHLTVDRLKHKKPLFTTEDGVDVCHGDKYYEVFIEKNWQDKQLYVPFEYTGNKHLHVCTDKAKFFSTKEAAEEYILMNKPCLSVNDIEAIACVRKQNDNTWIDEVKRLVKKRL